MDSVPSRDALILSSFMKILKIAGLLVLLEILYIDRSILDVAVNTKDR